MKQYEVEIVETRRTKVLVAAESEERAKGLAHGVLRVAELPDVNWRAMYPEVTMIVYDSPRTRTYEARVSGPWKSQEEE